MPYYVVEIDYKIAILIKTFINAKNKFDIVGS